MKDEAFWKGKKVFLTGHTGFKGSWLTLYLSSLGAEVHGYSLDPPTSPSLFEQAEVSEFLASDIRDNILNLDRLIAEVKRIKPDFVMHLAAQPLVRYSYQNPVETFSSNVTGTASVLEAVRMAGNSCICLCITTDKVYENRDWHWGYREVDRLGGHDPYSASKACSELVIASYRKSFFPEAEYSNHGVLVSSARAGNVFGGGDWSQDRLIPDIVRAFMKGEKVLVRYPEAVRPWQHVLEPLSQYVKLCKKMYESGSAYASEWNFGPSSGDALSVAEICDIAVNEWGGEASWEPDMQEHPHEAGYLYLDIAKAVKKLGYQPKLGVKRGLSQTFSWYRQALNPESVLERTLFEVEQFISK